jgi:hypothetical protein
LRRRCPEVVPKRDRTSHPHAFSLGGGDLVPDALAGHFPFELGEGEKHIEGKPPHGGGGVELPGHRDKRNPVAIKKLDHLREVREGSGKPIDLVDHHHVDLSSLDIDKKRSQPRALHGAAGEAGVVVAAFQRFPALMALTLDIGGAGLALRV